MTLKTDPDGITLGSEVSRNQWKKSSQRSEPLLRTSFQIFQNTAWNWTGLIELCSLHGSLMVFPGTLLLNLISDDEVMKRSQAADNLTTQGHSIQIFVHLSPYTVQKRRSFKPLLKIWNVSYRNKGFSFSSFIPFSSPGPNNAGTSTRLTQQRTLRFIKAPTAC